MSFYEWFAAQIAGYLAPLLAPSFAEMQTHMTNLEQKVADLTASTKARADSDAALATAVNAAVTFISNEGAPQAVLDAIDAAKAASDTSKLASEAAAAALTAAITPTPAPDSPPADVPPVDPNAPTG